MKKQEGSPAVALTEAGQTLLEVLLAFSVSLLVLSAIIYGITISLSNTQYAKNQNLANSYAQEGMAVVRKIRDSSWYDFYTGLSDYSSNTKYCIDKNLMLRSISSALNCVGNDAVGTGGIFSREVKFEHNSSSCCSNDDRVTDPNCTNIGSSKGSKATVKVSWTDNKCPAGNPFCHAVELITCFSNIDQKSLVGFVQPILREYYNAGDNVVGVAYVDGTIWTAQTFTPSTAHTITSVKLKLFRVGLPGTVTVSIRATSGGMPTGNDLVSNTIDGNTLTADSAGVWYEIKLGAGYSLSAGIQYAIVIRAPSGNSGSNSILWRASNAGNYSGGNTDLSNDSGSTWPTSYTGYDSMFEEWGK